MCDDVSMQALSGSLGSRTSAVLDAGCDCALHCNGEFEEMVEVASHSIELNGLAKRRFGSSFDFIKSGDKNESAFALSMLAQDWSIV